MVGNKDFEIMKDSITKIVWEKEGFLHGGHFLFNTTQGDFQVDTRPKRGDASVVKTTNTILGALVVFAPDRLYNEKTGALVHDEVVEKMKQNPRKFGKYNPDLP
jgi:hypothetical protein